MKPIHFPDLEVLAKPIDIPAANAQSVGQHIFDDATDKVLAINALPIAERPPADKLTPEQRCAFFVLAGFMRYENGKLRSIRPVAINDDGKGGYIVGIAPEGPPEN